MKLKGGFMNRKIKYAIGNKIDFGLNTIIESKQLDANAIT